MITNTNISNGTAVYNIPSPSVDMSKKSMLLKSVVKHPVYNLHIIERGIENCPRGTLKHPLGPQ